MVKKSHKILIADDEPDIRDLLGDYLESEGYECILAADAFEALKKFKEDEKIDIVMSDIRMPGKTGLELLSEIKSIDQDVIVIMISAVKDIESAISAMSKGADDYVTKPFKLTAVAQNVHKAIDKRKLILENREYQRGLERMVAEKTADLSEALEKLAQTYTITLRALVAFLDKRDQETHGHSSRVVEYTLKLAGLMNIEAGKQLKILEHGSLLHDIGKIGIPDAILRKDTVLTPQEWKIMKTHPRIGFEIINKIEFLRDAAQIVLNHHEQYDGSGYPQGLAGEDIPMGSRIFIVADVIDAITSSRPYRKAMSFETAANELKKHSGKQFDPKVVDAFFSVDLDYWKDLRKEIDNKLKSMEIFDITF